MVFRQQPTVLVVQETARRVWWGLAALPLAHPNPLHLPLGARTSLGLAVWHTVAVLEMRNVWLRDAIAMVHLVCVVELEWRTELVIHIVDYVNFWRIGLVHAGADTDFTLEGLELHVVRAEEVQW